MKVSQNQEKQSSLTFEESVRLTKEFITKMRDSNTKLRIQEDQVVADALAVGDLKLQHAAGNAIVSLQNAEALFLIVDYLLTIVETQNLVNQQLLGHIKDVAGDRVELTPAVVGEIVRAGFDQLAKEAEERTRKLSRSVYG